MRYGTVKSWNEGRGFGFARCDDGEDFFLHAAELRDKAAIAALRHGARIQFAVAPAANGGVFDRATDVELLEAK